MKTEEEKKRGEAIRLLRTNSSKTTFEECLSNFKLRLETRGYPKAMIEMTLTGVTFALRQSENNERILPFITTHHHK